jgi:hypothetical protein
MSIGRHAIDQLAQVRNIRWRELDHVGEAIKEFGMGFKEAPNIPGIGGCDDDDAVTIKAIRLATSLRIPHLRSRIQRSNRLGGGDRPRLEVPTTSQD